MPTVVLPSQSPPQQSPNRKKRQLAPDELLPAISLRSDADDAPPPKPGLRVWQKLLIASLLVAVPTSVIVLAAFGLRFDFLGLRTSECLLIGGVVALIAGVLIAVRMILRVSGSLKRLAEQADIVADGLREDLAFTGDHDEIGRSEEHSLNSSHPRLSRMPSSA